MRRRLVGVLMMAACLGNAQAQLHLKANVQNNHGVAWKFPMASFSLQT